MFYKIQDAPKGLLNACIVPRPLAWISSISKQGKLNLAPYSYFNIVSENPAMIVFSTTKTNITGDCKDTLKNIEATKEFVINIAPYHLREAMILTSAQLPNDISEFDYANIEHEPSTLVKVPRVKLSPIHLECIYYDSIQLPKNSENYINRLIIGKIIAINIKPEIITDGKIDVTKYKPIAKLGYSNYTKIDNDIFNLQKPNIYENYGIQEKIV